MMRKVTVSVCGNIEVSARLIHTQILLFRSIYSIYLIYLVNLFLLTLTKHVLIILLLPVTAWLRTGELCQARILATVLQSVVHHTPTPPNHIHHLIPDTLNHSSLHWTDHDCSVWIMINNKVMERMNRVEMPLFSVICLGKTVFLNFSIFLINGFSYQFYRFYFAYSLVPSKSLRKN